MTDRLLRLSSVTDIVGFKTTRIYALIARGEFPCPVKIGRSSRWVESEIHDWIAARALASRSGFTSSASEPRGQP